MWVTLSPTRACGLTYPVLCFLGSSLQAFLQPLPNTSWFAELSHQLLRVVQLLLADDGLQSQQVPVQRLLQRRHWEMGQRFLMDVESAWDLA